MSSLALLEASVCQVGRQFMIAEEKSGMELWLLFLLTISLIQVEFALSNPTY